MIARAYLLGLLDLDQRLQVEREVLESEDTYRHLLAVEAALIDEYVRGVLVGPGGPSPRMLVTTSAAPVLTLRSTVPSWPPTAAGTSVTFLARP